MSDERSLAEALSQRPAQSGDVIAGRFRIDGELGSGGMARVFRVTDLATSNTFALKLLRPEIADDEEAIARLRREGELLDRLDNPAIVGIETYGKLPDGRLFLVMELLEGQTLGELMRTEKRLDPEALTPVVTGVAAGLHAAHEAGVVHRDLKPDNIFLTEVGDESGSQTQVKILDFGISKAVGFERLTRTGQVLGTPRYMAPEQLAADHDLDARVDVYAMGVILYEALAGQPPFVAVSPSDLIVAILHGKVTPLRVYRPELGDDVLSVVARAMARARDARYGSARELAEAWVDAAQPRPARAPAPQRGMRTKALGGADDPTPDGRGEGGDDLRPGTFSALEGAPAAGIPVPDVPSASASSSEAPTIGARASTMRRPPEEPSEAPTGLTGTLRLPIANRRTWLLVAALFAGALTALVVILVLHLLGDDPPQMPHSMNTPSVAPVAVTPGAAAGEAPAEAPGADPEDLPVAPEPPAAESAGDPRPSPMAHRSSRRSRSTTMAPSAAGPRPEPAASLPPPATEQSPLQLARTALAHGDADACLEHLEGFGASAPVLRLRADCQLRAGHRSEAVKTYERFCRRYPTHGSIAEVRAIVTRNGGRCP